MASFSSSKQSKSGCGCLAVTMIAVLSIIGLVGAMTMLTGPVTVPFTKEPIPDNVPPAAADPAPAVATSIPEGRPANQLAQWAESIATTTRISQQAVQAYGLAERRAAEEFPQCNLHWNTLAGLGYVETRHGTYGGDWFKRSNLNEVGVAVPVIIGVPLDGSPGFAEIHDTDGGALDGDKQWDRAVGPMQFIPESWQQYGVDASGDGTADPNQIDDAAASAARLLCAGGRDLSTEQGWAEAIRSYNFSGDYLLDVRDAAANYALAQPA